MPRLTGGKKEMGHQANEERDAQDKDSNGYEHKPDGLMEDRAKVQKVLILPVFTTLKLETFINSNCFIWSIAITIGSEVHTHGPK